MLTCYNNNFERVTRRNGYTAQTVNHEEYYNSYAVHTEQNLIMKNICLHILSSVSTDY